MNQTNSSGITRGLTPEPHRWSGFGLHLLTYLPANKEQVFTQ